MKTVKQKDMRKEYGREDLNVRDNKFINFI